MLASHVSVSQRPAGSARLAGGDRASLPHHANQNIGAGRFGTASASAPSSLRAARAALLR
jgi:hypothetical protein